MAILPEATPAPKGSRPPRGLRRVARGCGALVLGLTLGLTSLPFGTQAYAAPGVVRGGDVDAPRSASAETPNPTEVLSPSLEGATGERAVFVRLRVRVHTRRPSRMRSAPARRHPSMRRHRCRQFAPVCSSRAHPRRRNPVRRSCTPPTTRCVAWRSTVT